jgi:GNAT superfamily N-acetyltransferase
VIEVQPFNEHEHLFSLQDIISRHVETAIPGWALPAQAILQNIKRNFHEAIIDPWVIERKTLCVMDNGRLLAAAHLLRYGDGEAVGEWYKNKGDVAWFVAWPNEPEGGASLLAAAREQMVAWGVKTVTAWDSSLGLPLLGDVPDCWPHIRKLLVEAGFERLHPREEAIFGGWLTHIPPPGDVPVPGVTMRRVMTQQGVAFTAYLDDQAIGWCQVVADLTDGGENPNLRGWAELSEMQVDETWQNRGLGAWLVRHAVEWLRLAGCDRIALAVASDNEARGAGRFYERFGWRPFCRREIGWGYRLSTGQL